jgi:hypothetical protein
MFRPDFLRFTSSIMRRRRTIPKEKGTRWTILWRKDPKNENEQFTKAVELEPQAVLGRLEEPLIVAACLQARRGNSHYGKTPAW